ncbi:MAG: hypothetical protein R2809_07290 [Flavobacteriales bacterium]
MSKIEPSNSDRTLDVIISQHRDFKQIKELKKRAVELRKMGGSTSVHLEEKK